LLVALSAALLLPGLLVGIAGDAALFALVGERLLAGDMPYRDLWDHKPPGIYLIAAAAAALPLPTWPAIWLATVLAVALTAWILYRLLLPRHGRHPAELIAGLVCVAMGIFPVSMGGGMTETFATALGALAIALASRGRWVRAGILGGASIVTSLLLVSAILGILLMAGVRPSKWLRLVLGGALVAVPLVAWLAANDSLSPAFDQVVTYNRAYAAAVAGLEHGRLLGLLLAVLPLAALAGLRGPVRVDALDLGALGWLGAGGLLLLLQGRAFEHYAATLIVPLAILAGPTASRIHRELWTRRLMAIALAAMVVWGIVGTAYWVGRSEARVQLALGHIVALNTSGRDRILVWGSGAAVYLAASRPPATRYVHWAAHITPGYTTPAGVDAWITELTRNPPVVIVDAVSARDFPNGAASFRVPGSDDPSGRTLDYVDDLRAFVRENYEVISEIEHRFIYRLRVSKPE